MNKSVKKTILTLNNYIHKLNKLKLGNFIM